MHPKPPKQRLEGRIAALGVPLGSLTPEQGLELMIDTYYDEPDASHLSASWGVVTRFGPEELGFQFNLWHLLPPDGSVDDGPSFLDLRFKFGPESAIGTFPEWSVFWKRDQPTALREAVEASAAFRAWGRSPANAVALEHEPWARIPAFPLYDCWGVANPSRPIVSMTEEEWLRSDDVVLMLQWFRQEWRGYDTDLNRLIHRYLLGCCRAIWKLLPQPASRAGVEAAERRLLGVDSGKEFAIADWMAESAAFLTEPDAECDFIARWCDELARIPPEELGAMLHATRPDDDLSPRNLLHSAAYFASSSMHYSGHTMEQYRWFLCPTLLREMLGNPFRRNPDPVPSNRQGYERK